LESLRGEGGTMMVEGIKAALDFPHDPRRLRFVCFLTDGYIGNEAEILREIHDRLGASRIFSFGIGSSVNRYLMDQMAKTGRGAVAYLGPREDAAQIMEAFFERISQRKLRKVAIVACMHKLLTILNAKKEQVRQEAYRDLLVYAGKLTPKTLCPNYVISEEILRLEPRTVYVAHEFVQMVPLYGFETYQKMRAVNPWVQQMLPNATTPLHWEPEYRPGRIGRCIKGFMEWLLGGRIGEQLDVWEMKRKIRKFAARAALAHGSVIFDRNQVKGHFDDHGASISLQFQRRLDEFGFSASERAYGESATGAPGECAIASSSA